MVWSLVPSIFPKTFSNPLTALNSAKSHRSQVFFFKFIAFRHSIIHFSQLFKLYNAKNKYWNDWLLMKVVGNSWHQCQTLICATNCVNTKAKGQRLWLVSMFNGLANMNSVPAWTLIEVHVFRIYYWCCSNKTYLRYQSYSLAFQFDEMNISLGHFQY